MDRWRLAVDCVKAASARHGASLANGRLLFIRTGEVGLYFLPAAGFHRTTVTAQSGRAAVEKALAIYFGAPTRLLVDDTPAGAAAPPSLAELDAHQRAAREKSTDSDVRNHPAVRAALRLLGGELEHVQVLEPEVRPALEVEGTDETG